MLVAVTFAALVAGGVTLVSGISSGATTKPRPAPLHRFAVPPPGFALPPGLLRRLTPFGIPRPQLRRALPAPFGVPPLPVPPASAMPCYVASDACSLHPCTEFVSPRATPVPSVALTAPAPRQFCRPPTRLQPVATVVVGGSGSAPVALRSTPPVLLK